nr:LacI family DNA-binding transcriptional regulator [Entomohabitans teleogrylli]
MITLEDVAAYAGVSRATVSRVVNGDNKVKPQTRQRVEEAIAALNYAPNPAARALASSQSHTIGLVTSSYRGGFFATLMDTVQTETDLHGKQLLVTQGRGTAEKELQAVRQLYNFRCDGLLIHLRALPDEAILHLAREGRHFILLDRLVSGLEERCVVFDHRLASYLATRYFIAKGHQQVACLFGPITRISSLLRRQGFIDAMAEARLTPVACLPGEYDIQSGYMRMQEILRLAQPTAVYCCNEEMAVGAMLAITEAGLKIPADISCICYDSGERAAFVRPALTSVHFPIDEMARYATRKLLRPELAVQVFRPQIIERDSVRTL